MSDFDLNLVTASISSSIQDVRELHALSPPSAGQYALGGGTHTPTYIHSYTTCPSFKSVPKTRTVRGRRKQGGKGGSPPRFVDMLGP